MTGFLSELLWKPTNKIPGTPKLMNTQIRIAGNFKTNFPNLRKFYDKQNKLSLVHDTFWKTAFNCLISLNDQKLKHRLPSTIFPIGSLLPLLLVPSPQSWCNSCWHPVHRIRSDGTILYLLFMIHSSRADTRSAPWDRRAIPRIFRGRHASKPLSSVNGAMARSEYQVVMDEFAGVTTFTRVGMHISRSSQCFRKSLP